MRILYAGGQAPGSSSLYRRWALEKLGHEVVPFDIHAYLYEHSLLHKIAFRLAAGPKTEALNRDLMRLAEQVQPEVFWADKVLQLQPRTLETMERMGITTVSYMIDNAFGPRRDPGWRLYTKDVPWFDLHITQRDVSVRDLKARGARAVMKVQTAYEQTIHYAPLQPPAETSRDRGVSFIGTPYDDRAEILGRLGAAGVPVVISGNRRSWQRALNAEAFAAFYRAGELYEQQYREAIWRSKINLSFLTRSNQDEYTHKSFEIAGCGGFLLAERSEGHALKFREDEEAVFFSGYDELLAKVRQYLPDEVARARIAAAGHARAVRDGYHNDHQIALMMERVQAIRVDILARRQGKA